MRSRDLDTTGEVCRFIGGSAHPALGIGQGLLGGGKLRLQSAELGVGGLDVVVKDFQVLGEIIDVLLYLDLAVIQLVGVGTNASGNQQCD